MEVWMNRNVWMAAALACAASVGVAAQDKTAAQQNSDKTITVSGCVQNISTSTASGSIEKGFLLANATTGDARDGSTPGPPPPPAPRPTGTSGTAAAGMPESATWPATTGTVGGNPPPQATSYMLTGRDVELKEQVGKKVEITGTVMENAGAATGSSSTAPATDKMASHAQRLQVASLRVLASDCSSR
jgi:hypothetical protein